MADYTTNMKTLLSTLKTKVSGDARMSSVKTHKRGILTKIPVFPAVFYLPRNESISTRFTNGTYNVNRELELIAYTKKLPFQDAATDAMDLIDDISDIVQENYQLEAATDDYESFHVTKGNSFLGEDPPFRDGSSVQSARLPVTFVSRETRPARTVNFVWGKTTAGTILDRITSVLQADATLSSSIKTWTKQTIPPIPAYPAISIAVDSEVHGDRQQGIEDINRPTRVILWSKLTNGVTSLESHLDLVEVIKDALQASFQFDDGAGTAACWNSFISSIEYGSASDAERGYLYATSIQVMTKNHRLHHLAIPPFGNAAGGYRGELASVQIDNSVTIVSKSEVFNSFQARFSTDQPTYGRLYVLKTDSSPHPADNDDSGFYRTASLPSNWKQLFKTTHNFQVVGLGDFNYFVWGEATNIYGQRTWSNLSAKVDLTKIGGGGPE